MRNSIFLLLIFIAALHSSAVSQRGLQKKIESVEQDLMVEITESQGHHTQKAQDLAKKLQGNLLKFARKYHGHEDTPDMLFKAGRLSEEVLDDATEAHRIYDQIISEYKEHVQTPFIFLVKGMLYQKQGNQEGAKWCYETVKSRYPDSKASKDADAMLQFLHLSDEEIIEEFSK